MLQTLRTVETLFLDLIFPKRCVTCGKDGAWSCESCSLKLIAVSRSRVSRVGSQQVFSGLDFAQPMVRELLHTLKYNGISDASADLVRLMQKGESGHHLGIWLHELLGRGEVILVPVPITRSKLKSRGYNQAEEIAKQLGRELGLDVCVDLLMRRGKSSTQVGKDKVERVSRLHDVFWIREDTARSLEQKIWIVVDDLFTTGSTLQASFEVLLPYVKQSLRGITVAYKR